MITGIVAIAENFAIGKNGRLPWHYPADLKFFKETTTGNVVVMGFHTWQSIGRPLPKRLNIVLSRSADLENRSDVLLLRSKADVLALSQYLKGNLFIIGGAQTFREFADVIERWIVTKVPQHVEDADVLMPNDFLEGFELRETKVIGDDLRVEIFARKTNLL